MDQQKSITAVWRWIQSFWRREASPFTYLNVAQFLGALNDNMFKWLLVYFVIQLEGVEKSPKILALAGTVFVLPFLLFSSYAGILADRHSKRNVVLGTKVLELVVMVSGCAALLFGSGIGAYVILFLMATQSALFGPAKYGIIPELVPKEEISRVNGLLTSFTFLAMIIGTFLPSFILGNTGRSFFLSSLVCILFALLGVFAAWAIQPTNVSGDKRVRAKALGLIDVVNTLRKIRGHKHFLLTAIFTSSFFWLAAAYFQMNMIPFAVEEMGMQDTQGGYLFLLTALGIGVGALAAGKISGKQVELGLVPIGGLGIIVGCFLLDWCSSSLASVLILVTLLGVFGGLWVIPVESYIQLHSPPEQRGQVIAATNFLTFVGVLGASGYLALIDAVGLSPGRGFTLMGVLILFVGLVICYLFFDYVARFLAMCLARVRFQMTYSGREHLPEGAALYVCQHTAWNDTLIIMGSQRERTRFFIQQEQGGAKIWRFFYRMLRLVFLPDSEEWDSSGKDFAKVEKLLRKGVSCCFLCASHEVQEEARLLHEKMQEAGFADQIPIIAIYIDQREVKRRFRCPAVVTFSPRQ